MPITCALPKAALSAARSATSSRCRCVEGIIARFTAARDEAAWWRGAGVDPTVTARALWLGTHPLPTVQDETAI